MADAGRRVERGRDAAADVHRHAVPRIARAERVAQMQAQGDPTMMYGPDAEGAHWEVREGQGQGTVTVLALMRPGGRRVAIRAFLLTDEGQAEVFSTTEAYQIEIDSLRVDADPHRTIATVMLSNRVAGLLRAGDAELSWVDCNCDAIDVVNTICGPSVVRRGERLPIAVERDGGVLADADDRCVQGLQAIDEVLAEQRRNAHATLAQRVSANLFWQSAQGPSLPPPENPPCTLPDDTHTRDVVRRVSDAVRPAYVSEVRSSAANLGGTSRSEALSSAQRWRGDVVIASCVDAPTGALLALAMPPEPASWPDVDRPPPYGALYRVDRAGPRVMHALEPGQRLGPWAYVDFTGDGVPETLITYEAVHGAPPHEHWEVASTNWPAPLTVFDHAGPPQSDRADVYVVRGTTAAAILREGEIVAWDGHAFAPVTTGFEPVRAAVAEERAELQRVADAQAALAAALPAAPGDGDPCVDGVRRQWASAMAQRLGSVGVAMERAEALASAPAGVQGCRGSAGATADGGR